MIAVELRQINLTYAFRSATAPHSKAMRHMRGMAESNNEKWKINNEKLDLHSRHENAELWPDTFFTFCNYALFVN